MTDRNTRPIVRTPLNRDWTFKKGYDRAAPTTRITGEPVDLPHSATELSEGYFDETMLEGHFTYQKHFRYDLSKGRRLFVRFEGVMAKAKVHFNGVFLAEHVGGYTTFRLELTGLVQEENLLVVFVDSHETGDHPPFGGLIDYLTYGGIYREVTLIETGQIALDHVLIDGNRNDLRIRLKRTKESPDEARDISFDIHRQGKRVASYESRLEGEALDLKVFHELELWSLDNPVLYDMVITANGEEIARERFGIREIRVTKDAFYLNEEPVFLQGLNRHQSFPYVGYAMPKSAQQKDVDILKDDLGVTIVRSSHYPPSRHFLDRCDERGLMVFTEMPGWQHLGDADWKERALADLRALLITDYNHPSVVMVGTRINESPDDDDFYQRTRALAESIDTSRPTGGVRNFPRSHLLEDVYTVNDFHHRGNNAGITKKKRMTKSRYPYLITEHTGHMFPTKSFDPETNRIEQARRHAQVLSDASRSPGVMGAIGWCMNDYHTHHDFGSNDHVCHHGVLDINRNPKYAAALYASQRSKPYMEVASMMQIGDYPGGELKSVYVFTNVDYLEVYRNGERIGRYEHSGKYPGLAHPPIVITDLIGDLIERHEPFSKRDARMLKRIMLAMLGNDLKMTLSMKVRITYIMLKYHLKYADLVELYTKYVGGWGDRKKHYLFKGYRDGKVVAEVEKGHDDHYRIDLMQDGEAMEIGPTYDVMRLTVELKNRFGERAFYSKEVFTIEVTGNLTLIGPDQRSLQGGIQSFWVKAKEKGQGEVLVRSNHYGHCRKTIRTN
ncbi:MAG: glycoside hydrolase family 2 protein [Acholeplasmataceae bacterium]